MHDLKNSKGQMNVLDELYPSVKKNNDNLVKLRKASASKNGNMHDRCGCDEHDTCSSENHGESYVDVDYNYGIGEGKYKIIVRIKHNGIDYYGTGSDAWEKYMHVQRSHNLFETGKLTRPGDTNHRGGYFMSGSNDTYGDHNGALGLEVLDKNSEEQLWWAIWYFDQGWGDWGSQWLRCGHGYGFWFEDN
ncbi:hypothetical protein ACTHQ0_23965 [Priestia megaterium]|uniref:hypothetical protein n=1 Tax=Priestia megaterium TaxID=1404 RepID=UPI003F803F42